MRSTRAPSTTRVSQADSRLPRRPGSLPSLLAADLPNALPFTSILSLDVKKDADCDPARILVLYGMSKDFGANGFRGGALVCQHNPKFMQAISSNAMTMRMGSPTVCFRPAVSIRARKAKAKEHRLGRTFSGLPCSTRPTSRRTSP